MKKLAFTLIASLALAGCVKPAETTSAVGAGFNVERLFKHDGCTVYRFVDSSYRYFVRCDGGSAETSWSENCGKGCIRPQQVVTGNRP